MRKAPKRLTRPGTTEAARAFHNQATNLFQLGRRPGELQPIHASAGLNAAYNKRLRALVTEMHESVLYWLKARYRAEMGLDAHPSRELRAAIRKLARRWQANFDRVAPQLADYFATAASERVDGALQSMLRKAGFTVRFKMSRNQSAAVQAVVAENVSLIKSIATKYLDDVENEVMRSVSRGRDLGALTEALQERYNVTKNRAALIARQQNNAATAAFTKTRQKELGIKKARWQHSAGGKQPRPEHVAFSGKTYDIEKGAFLEGKWTWPGMEINCRCVSVPIIPGFDD